MGRKLASLAIDVKAAEEGEWRDHPYLEDIRVLVRSSESDRYQKRLTAEMAKIPRHLTGEARADRTTDALNASSAELVGGWEGIDDAPYTPETAEAWATTRLIAPGKRLDPAFFLGIRELAESIGRADAEAVEASTGNSRKGSSTGSSSRRSTSASAST